MDLTSSQPIWPLLDGIPHAYPRLHGDARADVVVIGGGITGALVAHALVEAGIDTVLLDKREIGWGSTAASTSLVQYEIDVPLTDLRRKRGADDADRAYRACRDALDALARLVSALDTDVGYRTRSSLYIAPRKRDLRRQRAELEARRAIGLDVQWLDRDELVACFGIDRPGAILSAAAAEVDAYALAHALLAAAVQRGLRVHARTGIASVEGKEDGVTLTLDEGGIVAARHVVFATGYESAEFLRDPPARLISTFALASEPGSVPTRWRARDSVIWERADPYLYLRTTSDGRVIVGGEDESFRNPAHRDALLGRKVDRLRRRYADLFDGAELDVAFAWAGTFGETEDGLPCIGAHPDWPRCYFAIGYGGNGITFSVLAAEILRDALVGRTNRLADLFRFGR